MPPFKPPAGVTMAAPYCSFASQIQLKKQNRVNAAKANQPTSQNNYDHHNLMASRILDDEQAF